MALRLSAQRTTRHHIPEDDTLLLTIYLFKDAVSSTDYVASNSTIIVNNDLERMWKEAVVA
jgi:hypothetical protein